VTAVTTVDVTGSDLRGDRTPPLVG